MEKPIVLKRHLRLQRWEIGFLVMWLGFLLWWLTQNIMGGIVCLSSFALISAHRFLRRVTLSPDSIAIWDDAISNRVTRFEQIVNYHLKPDEVEVEVTVRQLHEPSYAIFSNRPASPARRQQKTIRFVVEPEQTEELLGYLHSRGAVVDKVAEKEWRETQILLAAGREISRLKKERGESAVEMQEILRQMEVELAKVKAEF